MKVPAKGTPLRQRMIEDMGIRNLSPATQYIYVNAVAKYALHFGKSPAAQCTTSRNQSPNPRLEIPSPSPYRRSARHLSCLQARQNVSAVFLGPSMETTTSRSRTRDPFPNSSRPYSLAMKHKSNVRPPYHRIHAFPPDRTGAPQNAKISLSHVPLSPRSMAQSASLPHFLTLRPRS